MPALSERSRLLRETNLFKLWATQNFPGGAGFGEWECDYPEWDRVYSATLSHLNTYSPAEWDSADIDCLLYVLARDNEVENIKYELERRPGHLLSLSRLALSRPSDWEARWQLADGLSKLPPNESVPVLEQYFRDEHEYVRRRALLALAKLESPRAEELAILAWASGDEYHRMCAISALYRLKSPLLSRYLSMADEDGREHLVGCAARIRAGEDFERL